MTMRHLTVIGAAALVLSALPGHAGPCSKEIERMQAELDARIEMIIDIARFVREARRAFGLPAPIPSPPASAESSPGDGSWMGRAVASMARAREADRSGDRVACANALADLQRAVGRQ
jgi:hypothetical protein